MQPLVTLTQNDWSLHRKGPIDLARHNAKVKEAIRGDLPAIVGEEAIITADGNKVVKVPIRSLELPHFRFRWGDQDRVGQGGGDSKTGDVVGKVPGAPSPGVGRGAGDQPGIDYYEAELTVDEIAAMVFEDLGLPFLQPKSKQRLESEAVRFTDVRRSGPMSNLDKRRTIMQNLRRNARAGQPSFGGLSTDDLRFRTWEPTVVQENNAVVIAMRDVSGSMGEFEKYITRSFYFWMVRFLRATYANVEIVFITHHTEAREVDEDAFFHLGESGGTRVSSAYQLALDIIDKRYQSSEWNTYAFHFSDGDNWGDVDNQQCLVLVRAILERANAFGYGEISEGGRHGRSTLMNAFEPVQEERFVRVGITSKEDVYPALRTFFRAARRGRRAGIIVDVGDAARLEAGLQEIWDVAVELGLDPYPVHFELVPAAIMHEFGAYGVPGRFAHWTYGRAYQQLKTLYDYGLSKIYELVINTNPAYAFLVTTNSVLQNKVVVAHVLGHVDFFKHNAYFAPTNRKMVEGASTNAERIRQYEYKHGTREVEEFLDAVLSIQEHVEFSVHAPARAQDVQRRTAIAETAYDDLFYLGGEQRPRSTLVPKKVPPEPEPDLLLFIAEHARGLEDWQRDILHIVRAEQLYFRPQMLTKIVNEGWAAYCHARIMRSLDLSSTEHLEFSRMHAGVLSPSKRQINPYYVGMKVFEDIERRFDAARVLEVRELENDVSLLRNYLTADLVEELDLYLYRREGEELVIVDKDWEHVRDTLVGSMTNFGQPYIVVDDGDYHANGELYLEHRFEGQELDTNYAPRTLEHVFRLWGRTVHLATRLGDKSTLLTFDGQEHLATAQ